MSVHNPTERGWCRQHRDRHAHRYAEMVGEIVCRTLQGLTSEAKRPRNKVLERTLVEQFKEYELTDCTIDVRAGEIHAFIGSPDEDYDHGHVIVPLKTRAIRYCRGYGEGRRDDAWNRWPYTRTYSAAD